MTCIFRVAYRTQVIGGVVVRVPIKQDEPAERRKLQHSIQLKPRIIQVVCIVIAYSCSCEERKSQKY